MLPYPLLYGQNDLLEYELSRLLPLKTLYLQESIWVLGGTRPLVVCPSLLLQHHQPTQNARLFHTSRPLTGFGLPLGFVSAISSGLGQPVHTHQQQQNEHIPQTITSHLSPRPNTQPLLEPQSTQGC